MSSQPSRDRVGDHVSGGGVWVPVPAQVRRRIRLDRHVRQPGLVKNPVSQQFVWGLFLTKLRHDNERRGSALARQIHGGAKNRDYYGSN